MIVFLDIPVFGSPVILIAESSGKDIADGNVKRDKLHIGVILSGFDDGAGKSIARHNEDIEAVINSLFNAGNTVIRVISGGLVVAERNVVFFAESLAGFIGGLVEGFVGYVAVVGDHRDLVAFGIATGFPGFFHGCRSARGCRALVAAVARNKEKRGEGEEHCKSKCQKSFHGFPPKKLN